MMWEGISEVAIQVVKGQCNHANLLCNFDISQ